MKLFMAALATETNTFSPIPSGRTAFHGREYFRGDGSLHPPRLGNVPLIEWRRLAEADGWEVAESLCAFATPAGSTQKPVYEGLRKEILDDLRRAMPVDVVLLFLHGAMVADGYDDCEGDVLEKIRAIVGPDVPVGVEIDLHCHLTERMRANADVIVAFKEYPHTDIPARAQQLYRLCKAAQRGEIRPVMALHDCRMIGVWRPPFEPMRSLVQEMTDQEGRDGILSVSFGHGFPWADIPDVGAKMLVVADGDPDKARQVAERFAHRIWDLRDVTPQHYDTIDEAIDIALAVTSADGGRPVVLADVADNAGAGAPSDNTAILHRLISRGISGVASGCYWDPVAVGFCLEAGVGATFDLRVGGKTGVASGLPADLRVTVMGLSEDHSQRSLGGGRSSYGPSAWVRGCEPGKGQGIDLILTSVRQQTHSPEAFTGLGCTLDDKRIIVVKSMQHFYTGFAPFAADVRYVAAPGAVAPDFASLPYTRRAPDYWPRVADPFSAQGGGAGS